MAITTAICDSFKEDLVRGIHNFTTDTFKLALYTNSATLNKNTVTYVTTGEVTGTGYTPGGVTVTNLTITNLSGTIIINFDNIVFTNATFTARGALLYNSSKSNKAVAVWDFGSDKIVNNSNFTIVVPPPSQSAAVLRIT
jgi:hypothetical protein